MTNSTPPLWPGFDPETDSAMARGWTALWAELGTTDWLAYATARTLVADAGPMLLKSADSLLRTARHNRLLERRGGYSHRTGRDTRQVRRHPSTTTEARP